MSRLIRQAKSVSVREEVGGTRLQVGRTKVELLELLSERPRYGYELWQDIRRARSITTASVYQHLDELERSALVRKVGVVTKGGRERILYEPTRKGADLLRLAGRLERAGLPKAA